mmetsp:Transcript_34561/g.64547  ORF Transcript_34561/g.64547 Transcript_34561/m.64547 type:complete len:313 (+) Transcript_34561:22-960(+)
MPRTAGGGALSAMAVKDANYIKKRERKGNDVTVPKVAVTPQGEFPDPPVQRFSPWSQQNASCTDIVIGSVSESGQFVGMMISDVQMQVLMRFFQMAMTYMPREAPPQIESLARQMQDGLATIVITRGAWGRELDEGHGPMSNFATPAIIEAVSEARVLNPNLHITCVDVPKNITGFQLSKILVQPLSDYRELIFYDGTWYIPQMVNAPQIAKQIREFARTKPLWHTRLQSADKDPAAKKTMGLFNRKAFPWREAEEDKNYFQKTYKEVFVDPDYPKVEAPVIERDFTGPLYVDKPPGSLDAAMLADMGEGIE